MAYYSVRFPNGKYYLCDGHGEFIRRRLPIGLSGVIVGATIGIALTGGLVGMFIGAVLGGIADSPWGLRKRK